MVRIEGRNALLRLVLVIAGTLFGITGIGAFLPVEQLKNLAGLFVGAEQLESMWPGGALFDYLLRVSCIAYFWIGITFFVACKDPRRYRAVIDLAILGLLLMALVCFTVGTKHRGEFPAIWYLCDAFLSLVGGILLIILRPKS